MSKWTKQTIRSHVWLLLFPNNVFTIKLCVGHQGIGNEYMVQYRSHLVVRSRNNCNSDKILHEDNGTNGTKKKIHDRRNTTGSALLFTRFLLHHCFRITKHNWLMPDWTGHSRAIFWNDIGSYIRRIIETKQSHTSKNPDHFQTPPID